MDERLIREIEALKVGPDDRLILRVPETWDVAFVGRAIKTLGDIGLGKRALVIVGDAVEFVVVEGGDGTANVCPDCGRDQAVCSCDWQERAEQAGD